MAPSTTGRPGGWWRWPGAGEVLDQDLRHLERQLGWTRLVGGIVVLVSNWQNPTEVPSWISGLLVAAGVTFLLTAAITPLATRTTAPSRVLADALSVSDAVVLAMLLPFGVAQDSPYLLLVFTATALLGGVRLGRLGVLRNLVIAAPFETVRLVVGQSLFGNQSVEDTGLAILVAGGIGILVADVADSGRRAAHFAAERQAAAERDRVRVRRLAWEQAVLADVVETAGTGPVDRALEVAVARISDHLDVAAVDLLTVGPTDGLAVAATTDRDLRVGSVMPILPGGPRDRALSLGTVAAATHDDLEALEATDGRARGSVVAAPLPVDGHLLGVLVCVSRAEDLLHRRDAALIGRLGRALAPFVATGGTDRSGPGDPAVLADPGSDDSGDAGTADTGPGAGPIGRRFSPPG